MTEDTTNAVDGGSIPDHFIDEDLRHRTVKLTLSGPTYLYRKELKQLLQRDCGIHDSDIRYIYKGKKAMEWFVVISTETQVRALLSHNTLYFDQQTTVTMERLTEQRINLKVHWLPAYVENAFLSEFFEQFGSVVKVTEDWNQELQVYSGLREVQLIIDESNRHKIPHTVTFNNDVSILITCPGRLPLCLKCHCLGHVRAECTNTARRPLQRSYAQAVQNNNTAETRSTEPLNPELLPRPVSTKPHTINQPTRNSTPSLAEDTLPPIHSMSWADQVSQDESNASTTDDDDDDMDTGDEHTNTASDYLRDSNSPTEPLTKKQRKAARKHARKIEKRKEADLQQKSTHTAKKTKTDPLSTDATPTTTVPPTLTTTPLTATASNIPPTQTTTTSPPVTQSIHTSQPATIPNSKQSSTQAFDTLPNQPPVTPTLTSQSSSATPTTKPYSRHVDFATLSSTQRRDRFQQVKQRTLAKYGGLITPNFKPEIFDKSYIEDLIYKIKCSHHPDTTKPLTEWPEWKKHDYNTQCAMELHLLAKKFASYDTK